MEMDVYWFYPIITSLILLVLVVVLRLMEQAYPKIKYISVSSIISFALVLLLILIKCCVPYEGWLCYLHVAITICIYIPFLITVVIVSLFNVQNLGVNFEDAIWLFIAFAISFVLYTFLIFVVIRIALYFKKKFWSGNALMRIV
jgi:hypothetical protein